MKTVRERNVADVDYLSHACQAMELPMRLFLHGSGRAGADTVDRHAGTQAAAHACTIRTCVEKTSSVMAAGKKSAKTCADSARTWSSGGHFLRPADAGLMSAAYAVRSLQERCRVRSCLAGATARTVGGIEAVCMATSMTMWSSAGVMA